MLFFFLRVIYTSEFKSEQNRQKLVNNLSILLTGVKLTKRGLSVIMILQFTFITWYYVLPVSVLQHIVGSSTEHFQMAYASFNFVIAITLLLSSFFINRFNKIRILYESSIAISIVTLLLLFATSTLFKLILVFVDGMFFSIGQLASFTYFWSLTVSEERGRAAGLAGFFSLLFFQLVSLVSLTFDFFWAVLLSFALSIAILSIKLFRPEKKALLTTKKDEKIPSFEKRIVLLYSAPWILFSFVNMTLARNVSMYTSQSVPTSLYMFLLILQALAASFGALSGGTIADFFGRRLSLGFSLTSYGISSALAGLFFENYGVLCFVYAVNGLNWGILWILYGSVVWGDLSNEESCARRYSIGLVTQYLSTSVGFLLTHQISQIPLVNSSLIGCLLIFLSNIPLLLAPELLSSDFRQRIRFRLYMNVIKKIGRKTLRSHG
jgi:MFS family permease